MPIQSQRQSAITTDWPTLASFLMTCQALTTWPLSTPSISAARGLAPVAMMTASGFSASISARVTLVRSTTLALGQLHLAREVGDDAAELGAAGQHLRQQRLSAQPLARLVERDIVPALGGNRRRLHAAGSAAGDHAPSSCGRRRQRAVGQLAPGLRMLDAGDRIAEMEMPDAGLVAADAGADVVQLAGSPPCPPSRDRRSSRASCRPCRPGRRR